MRSKRPGEAVVFFPARKRRVVLCIWCIFCWCFLDYFVFLLQFLAFLNEITYCILFGFYIHITYYILHIIQFYIMFGRGFTFYN